MLLQLWRISEEANCVLCAQVWVNSPPPPCQRDVVTTFCCQVLHKSVCRLHLLDENPIHCKHSWHTCSIRQQNFFQICPCDVCSTCTVKLYWGLSLRCIDNCTGKCSLDWILAFDEFQPRQERNQRGLSQHMVSTLGYWSSLGCVKCRTVASSLFLFSLDSLASAC